MADLPLGFGGIKPFLGRPGASENRTTDFGITDGSNGFDIHNAFLGIVLSPRKTWLCKLRAEEVTFEDLDPIYAFARSAGEAASSSGICKTSLDKHV